MITLWMSHRYWTKKMVIWKEREHKLDDAQAANDPMAIRALREGGLLKYFRVSGMRSHVCLLDHLIWMWDPDQQHFQVGAHILTIDVEEIYFLNGLSGRGRPISLTGPRGGEMFVDDLIDEHCVIRTWSQGGKIPIKHIVD